jgi:hypothetical protein
MPSGSPPYCSAGSQIPGSESRSGMRGGSTVARSMPGRSASTRAGAPPARRAWPRASACSPASTQRSRRDRPLCARCRRAASPSRRSARSRRHDGFSAASSSAASSAGASAICERLRDRAGDLCGDTVPATGQLQALGDRHRRPLGQPAHRQTVGRARESRGSTARRSWRRAARTRRSTGTLRCLDPGDRLLAGAGPVGELAQPQTSGSGRRI